MTHAASKFWLSQHVYLKLDDEPAIITEVIFVGDPAHPTTKYRLSFPQSNTANEFYEHEISLTKNYS